MKIDVEGHEEAVLMGARSLLANNQCFLQIESFDLSRIEPLLKEAGYTVKSHIGEDYIFELQTH